MEGKSGLNIVLLIVGILAIVAGIVLSILFGIERQLIPNLTLAGHLYVGLGAIGFGLLLMVGTNIATNARITADNTYDTMRHIEMLCQREGLTFADLARNDKAVAQKKVVMEAQEKLKQEKEAREKAEADVAALGMRLEQEASAQAQVQAEQAPVAEEAPVEAEVAEASVAEVAAEAEEAPAPAPSAPKVELNCGIAADVWKAQLEGMGKCETCGEPILIKTNKSGRVGLLCTNNGKPSCSERPMFIEDFASKFVVWHNSIYPEAIDDFSMEAFQNTVASFGLKNGDIHFVGK